MLSPLTLISFLFFAFLRCFRWYSLFFLRYLSHFMRSPFIFLYPFLFYFISCSYFLWSRSIRMNITLLLFLMFQSLIPLLFLLSPLLLQSPLPFLLFLIQLLLFSRLQLFTFPRLHTNHLLIKVIKDKLFHLYHSLNHDESTNIFCIDPQYYASIAISHDYPNA